MLNDTPFSPYRITHTIYEIAISKIKRMPHRGSVSDNNLNPTSAHTLSDNNIAQIEKLRNSYAKKYFEGDIENIKDFS